MMDEELPAAFMNAMEADGERLEERSEEQLMVEARLEERAQARMEAELAEKKRLKEEADARKLAKATKKLEDEKKAKEAEEKAKAARSRPQRRDRGQITCPREELDIKPPQALIRLFCCYRRRERGSSSAILSNDRAYFMPSAQYTSALR